MLLKNISNFFREKLKINEHSKDCMLILLASSIHQTEISQMYPNGFHHERLYQSLKQFIELEEKIELIWQNIDQKELISFPVLRLQYDEIINHDAFQWFDDKLNNYVEICDILSFELTEGMLKQLRNEFNLTYEPNSGPVEMSNSNIDVSNISSKITVNKNKGTIISAGGRTATTIKKQVKPIERKKDTSIKISDELQKLNIENPEPVDLKSVVSADNNDPTNEVTVTKISNKTKVVPKKQTIINTDNQTGVNKSVRNTVITRASSSKNLGVNYNTEYSRLSRTASAGGIKHKNVLNNYDKEYNLGVRSGVLNYKYTVGNALLEAQVLRRALKYVSKQGGTKQQLAIKKIRVWWIIVYPRYKYIRKLSLNSVIANILFEISDIAVVKSIIRKKRRLRHKREQAARVIQQALKSWKKESLWLLKKNSQYIRTSRLRKNISIWAFKILIGIALWKYTKKWRKRFMKRNPYRRPLYFIDFMEKWFMLQKQCLIDRKKAENAIDESGNISSVDKKRKNYVSKTHRAAIVIQKYARRLIVKHKVKNQRYLMFMKKKISRFMISTNINSRIKNKRNRIAGAILLQKWSRGFLERLRLFRRFDAGIKIYKFFIKIKSHASLRKSLRRVERPITIVLRGLRNINDSFDDGTDGISCKISIWWNPLLHIISENDFQTILTTKQPQLIYTSKAYPMTPFNNSAQNVASPVLLPNIIPNPSISFQAPFVKNRLSVSLFSSQKNLKSTPSTSNLNTTTLNPGKKTKWICKFDEEVEKIKIPGCHCNCLIKFEFLLGERKFGSHVYYMSKEGGLMFWNGNYSRNMISFSQRKAAINSRSNAPELFSSKKRDTKIDSDEVPVFDYSIYTGPPLRSRCQWGRVKFHGNGPGKRSMQQKGLLISLLEKWFKFYISVDGEALMLFDSKTTTQYFYKINVKDFKSIRVEQGVATRNEDNTSKILLEDLMDVILVTTHDVVYFRFFDTGSRVFWTETFNSIIEYNKKSSSGNSGGNNSTFLSGLGFKL